MIPDPSLIHYACVAKGTTVVAEFNSRDADLGALALKYLEKTPPYHSMYSHTVRGRTYMFLIDDPFVYFTIFDEKLENCEGLAFLKAVKEAFDGLAGANSGKRRLEKLNSHCFQGDFHPVFHQLLETSSADLAASPMSPRVALKLSHDRTGSLDSTKSMPLLGDVTPNGLKKKRRKLFGELIACGKRCNNEEMGEKELTVCDDGVSSSREYKNGFLSGELGYQKAKKAWKKQVWVVLSLDLIICTILFLIWLWVCRGFQCIDG